ncbi:hypothetical protein Mal64_03990 [Pseudobythopirellula maris]|uniref:Uncharacterized protein n=1 Tax=Pseudobythopirellula maris TaxID=2527991 RepID=A0A5C5ZS23_9BACT|nr:hypothetical protein [Pseudobythopirellula maris]TWT90016.1 hypothetical protein Mal64_03990 [Pseudobythopirellula maris]
MAFGKRRRSAGAAASRHANGLRVSAYDRVSSLLIALLLLVGMGTVGIGIIFFTRSITTVRVAIAVQPVEASAAIDSSRGAAEDPEPPGSEDSLETVDASLQDTLNLVIGAANSQLSLYDPDAEDTELNTPRGSGRGDHRRSGANQNGAYVQEPQREIRFEPASLDEYARWYDSAGMELAVLGRDNKVYYAASLSQAKPSLRTGDPTEEKRLYFNSTGGPLEGLDRQLAKKAGILSKGSVVLMFCQPQTQAELLALESAEAGGKPVEKIRRTVFRVSRDAGKGFVFSVERQDYY